MVVCTYCRNLYVVILASVLFLSVTSKELNDNGVEETDVTISNLSQKTEANDRNGSDKLTEEKNVSKISSDDKKEIEKKRLTAKLKLISKTLPVLDVNIGLTWFAALEKEFSKPYFKKLSDFVTAERNSKTIYPPQDLVWTWTKLCKVNEVKVVILGQDPYHNPRQAHGLCFSVPVGLPPPPSLVNMFKELSKNYKALDLPEDGYLLGWAVQGVLLLNAVLTVQANKPNSHKDHGWEQLTTAVIKHLSDNYKGLVFLLWGAYAQKKAEVVDVKKHHILKAAHPSPLSAAKGFFGCRHFLKCNELLMKEGKTPIVWDWLPSDISKPGENSSTIISPSCKKPYNKLQTDTFKVLAD
ncbi:uracil-DNA glycosylase-like isoform X2 [Lycorma delicatula]|uniref:uracil-DNA glycosylase-like isoform X2 n=1 Tax=Lycorma delicatula TaxID=130591 RepID=UPI003F511F2D